MEAMKKAIALNAEAANSRKPKGAGYGRQEACVKDGRPEQSSQEVPVNEPVDSQGLSDASVLRPRLSAAALSAAAAAAEEEEEGDCEAVPLSAEDKEREATLAALQREAKLADLRAQKAKLLEMKARGAKQQATSGKLLEAKLVQDKQEQAKLAYLEAGKQRGLKGFALVEYTAKLAEAMPLPDEEEEGNLEEDREVRAPVTDSHPQEGSTEEVTEQGIENGANLYNTGPLGNQEQPEERHGRQQASEFVSALPTKTKSINRKGHRTRHSEMPGAHRE